MDLIQEIDNQIKSKANTVVEAEKIAVDFVCHVDFNNMENKRQAEEYIKQKFNDVAEQNLPITTVEAKTIHSMIAKITLDNLGLNDVKIIYRDKTSADEDAAHYDENKSITFYNQNVCDENWLNPVFLGGDKSREGYKKQCGIYRFGTAFTPELQRMQHEIRHAVQFRELEENQKNKKDITPESYIISNQLVARKLAGRVTIGKYYKKDLQPDRLYKENWKNFYYELDAQRYGYEQCLEILKKLCPPAYESAIDEKKGKYLVYIEEYDKLLKEYSFVTWKHDTNPESLEVTANHKASMIIDYILPILNGAERKQFIEKYPALAIIYNQNGALKTLEQIEREKQAKIDHILIDGVDKEIQQKCANISKVYETAIENHPVLCFEKCLEHIARLSWGSDRYFTNGGIEEKYNPSGIIKELELSEQKAKVIASYVEDIDAKRIKKIFDKYKREVMLSPKHDPTSLMFFEDKKLAIYKIESGLYRNKEYKQTLKNDEIEVAKARANKKMKRGNAEKILRQTFPGFSPNPQVGLISNGSLEFVNNTNERLMLLEAYKRYVEYSKSNKQIEQYGAYVRSSELLCAINELYDFMPTGQDIINFKQKLNSGKIDIVKNKYENNEEKAEELNQITGAKKKEQINVQSEVKIAKTDFVTYKKQENDEKQEEFFVFNR